MLPPRATCPLTPVLGKPVKAPVAGAGNQITWGPQTGLFLFIVWGEEALGQKI